jgi:mannitol/fructose-specific phosphotransferase system IIA component (Ntr-type)
MVLKSSKNNKHKLFKDIAQLLLKNKTIKKLRK